MRAGPRFRRAASAAVSPLAPHQLPLLFARDRVNNLTRNGEVVHHALVDDSHAARGDGARREFFLAGHAEFPHQKNIERGTERPRHFVGDQHAAARQRLHGHILTADVIGKSLG